MAIYNAQQIGSMMYLAGFAPPVPDQGSKADRDVSVTAWLDTAVAVCMAESGGNTNAKNSSSSASGLWQIMYSIHKSKIPGAIKAAKELNVEGLNIPSDPAKAIFHPFVNTYIAGQLYKESGWKPWEVYNSGAYKSKLGGGKDALTGVRAAQTMMKEANKVTLLDKVKVLSPLIQLMDEDSITRMDGGIVDTVGGAIANPVKDVLTFAKSAGAIAGMFILGIVVLILGVWFIAGMKTPVTAVTGQVLKGMKK